MRIDNIELAYEIAHVERVIRNTLASWKIFHRRTFDEMADKLTQVSVDIARSYGDYPSGE